MKEKDLERMKEKGERMMEKGERMKKEDKVEGINEKRKK